MKRDIHSSTSLFQLLKMLYLIKMLIMYLIKMLIMYLIKMLIMLYAIKCTSYTIKIMYFYLL